LTTDLGVTALANSITLTPGTITLDVDGRDLIVHALTPVSAEEIETVFGARVARAFGRKPSAA
jgi:multicomponent Na+:H+ antiporter subunit E